MQARAMRREFSFQGLKLPDPDSKMSVEDVRGVLAMQYPEIATAAISGPEAVGDTMKYTFERAIGSNKTPNSRVVRRRLAPSLNKFCPISMPRTLKAIDGSGGVGNNPLFQSGWS